MMRIHARITRRAMATTATVGVVCLIAAPVGETQLPTKQGFEQDELFPFSRFGPWTCTYSVDKRVIMVRGGSLKRRTRVLMSIATRPPRSMPTTRVAVKQRLPAAGPGRVTLRVPMSDAGARLLRRRASARAQLTFYDEAKSYPGLGFIGTPCNLRRAST